MGSIGHIEEFDTNKPSTWSNYADRLAFYLEANGITDEAKKRATLLSVCGSATFAIVKSLLAPVSPAETTYDEIVTALRNHFSPLPCEIYERFQFQKRLQNEGETISSYIAELRRLSENCNFGETLTTRLRDQLVCGLRDEQLQRNLITDHSLTLDTALSKAQATEAATGQVNEIRMFKNKTIDVVNNIRDQDNRQLKIICFRCGGPHKADKCRFIEVDCNNCGKKGHIQRVCKSKRMYVPRKSNNTNFVEVDDEYEEDEYSIHQIKSNLEKSYPPVKINLKINNELCIMEVDSGSSYTIISEETFTKLQRKSILVLKQFTKCLRDFQQKEIDIRGICDVVVEYQERSVKLPLLVAKGERLSLLGRNWFKPLSISLSGVNVIQEECLDTLKEEFKEVFNKDLGCYKGPPISLNIISSVTPIKLKSRRLPFALKPRVDEALSKLISDGILEPITTATWLTPIVPVIKPTGEIRICADYKCTLNLALKENPYKPPIVKDLLAALAGGKIFAKLDLAQAYQQLRVDEESAMAQAIITHRGAFKVKRLQFGISVAPAIFQNFMDTLLAGIDGIFPYFDDILIIASNANELRDRLQHVLKRLMDAGIRLKEEKCVLCTTSIQFLGYQIDQFGLHPLRNKVKAIHDAPIPENKQQLQAFLGLLNFYNTFLKDKATVAEPLHRLLDSKNTWNWTNLHTKAFDSVKMLLTSDAVLMHFDEKEPVVLTCDASPYGIGGVLAHKLESGREVPIAFFSRTLSAAERNYSQLDKEALSLVASVKKFHDYLYGRSFTIFTDHKPLLGLLASNKSTPLEISPRMLRWSIILSGYNYELQYKPGKTIIHADALSRLPLPVKEFNIPPPLEVLMIESMECSPYHADEIAKMTNNDKTLSQVRNLVWKGWKEGTYPVELKTFYAKRNELSIHKDCLLFGNRVVIPELARGNVLKLLHEGHPGIVRMKAMSRSYFWWPGLDLDIERKVKTCSMCQSNHNSPPRANVHPWERTETPWSRLHIDFAGPVKGQTYLIVVDSFSKWLEILPINSPNSTNVILLLRRLFATHGLPDCIVSDNGTAFASSEFKQFCSKNIIRTVTVAPYHPSSNGQAERMVQIAKNAIKKMQGDLHTRLARYLLTYRSTPSTSTGKSPAQLLMNRNIKTILDRLHPDYAPKLSVQPNNKVRVFKENDPVYVRSYNTVDPPWVPATIINPTGPVSYTAETDQGNILRRHVDQIRGRCSNDSVVQTMETDGSLSNEDAGLTMNKETSEKSIDLNTSLANSDENVPVVSRPSRISKPPTYLRDFVM